MINKMNPLPNLYSFTIVKARTVSMCQFLRIADTQQEAEQKCKALLEFLKWNEYIATIQVIEDGGHKTVTQWKKGIK